MPALKNRIGERYGRLVVIERAPNVSSNRVAWKCHCDCGNDCIVAGNSLQSGNTKSCGCLDEESRIQTGKNNKKDLTGQTFGELTVLEDTGKRLKKGARGSAIIYKCKCNCGNIVEVEAGNLRSGNTMSCGCLGRSKGEYLIEELLKSANIPYKRDLYIDKNLYIQSKTSPLRFDFIITINNSTYIIEYDGEQHFRQPFSNNWERLEVVRKRDLIKNEYCFKNNIPIIRIPYTHLKQISLNDLILETSSFILTKEKEEEYYGIRS